MKVVKKVLEDLTRRNTKLSSLGWRQEIDDEVKNVFDFFKRNSNSSQITSQIVLSYLDKFLPNSNYPKFYIRLADEIMKRERQQNIRLPACFPIKKGRDWWLVDVHKEINVHYHANELSQKDSDYIVQSKLENIVVFSLPSFLKKIVQQDIQRFFSIPNLNLKWIKNKDTAKLHCDLNLHFINRVFHHFDPKLVKFREVDEVGSIEFRIHVAETLMKP